MTRPARIIGTYLSPYVRKVLIFLEQKGIPYEIDPIVPFFGDDRFSKLSPLRRIPVFIDDEVTLCDSSVICQYLEEKYPEPALYPKSIVERAQARWLEEFADTRMGEVFIWQLFNQVAIGPSVWGEKTNQERLEKTLNQEMPSVLDYLESQLPADGFLFGALSIADISIAVFFRNAAFSRFKPDPARWPRVAAFVGRVLKLDGFVKLAAFEDRLVRTPIARHREALAELGAPLMSESHATAAPRRGIMQI